jgi:hypothetical protein
MAFYIGVARKGHCKRSIAATRANNGLLYACCGAGCGYVVNGGLHFGNKPVKPKPCLANTQKTLHENEVRL